MAAPIYYIWLVPSSFYLSSIYSILFYIIPTICSSVNHYHYHENNANSIRLKAKTFGQTDEQMRNVQNYLEKIRTIEMQRHPQELSFLQKISKEVILFRENFFLQK